VKKDRKKWSFFCVYLAGVPSMSFESKRYDFTEKMQ